METINVSISSMVFPTNVLLLIMADIRGAEFHNLILAEQDIPVVSTFTKL
ncbi:MAG: hypothetical protein V3S22_01405 [Candidatus Neomarinimicrobiota bacterium]